MKVKDLISELQNIEDKEQEFMFRVDDNGWTYDYCEPMYATDVKQITEKNRGVVKKFVMIKFTR